MPGAQYYNYATVTGDGKMHSTKYNAFILKFT